jgi:hypothetical protein
VISSPPVICNPNPIDFGSLTIAGTSTIQVTCTANTAIINASCNISSTIFQCDPATLPSTVASRGSFTFPVVSASFFISTIEWLVSNISLYRHSI